MEKKDFTNEQICMFLDMLYQNNKRLEEKLDCILHTLCKNNDEKTQESIRKYLISDYRNTQSH